MKYISFIFILFLNCPVELLAQLDDSDLLELTIEELLNLEIVSSNKQNEKIMETPAFVNVISDKEIEMLGFTNLQDILEYVTGISSVNGEGNIFNTTTIRGNTLVNYNTNTLLLLDGIPIYSSYGGSFELSSIPLSSIERIEIVKGANAVLYGSNAVNATINIITKSLPNYKDENFKGRFLFGSNSKLYGNGALQKRVDDFEVSGFVEYNSTEGELLNIKDEKGNQIDFAQNTKTISFISKIKYKDIFTFHFLSYNRNIPNFRTRGFQNVVDDDGNKNFIPHRNDEFGIVLGGSFDYHFSAQQSIHLHSKYFDWKLNRDNLYSTWNYSSTFFSNELEYYFIVGTISSNLFGLSLNLLNARRYKSSINDYDIGKDNENTIDYSIYLNGSVELYKMLKLFYGGRYYSSSYKDVVLSNFSKRIALTYGINKNIFLKINYGESFRVPTYFEKEVSSGAVIGNANLYPEKSSSLDLILSHMFTKVKFDVDFFYTEIKDKITRVPYVQDPSIMIYQNIGTAEYYGIEIDSKFHFSNSFWGFAGYSYTVGKDKDSKQDLPFTYNNMFNLGFKIKIIQKVSLNTSAKYLDNWGKADSYIVFNCGVEVKPWKKSNILFELKVNNVFNTKIYLPEIARGNEVVSTIPKTFEREILVGVTLKL